VSGFQRQAALSRRERAEPDTASATYARPQVGVCAAFGAHWWWPLRAKETKATGVRSVCLRCGGELRVSRPEPLGVVRVSRAVVVLTGGA
jgi:hypothetical protein